MIPYSSCADLVQERRGSALQGRDPGRRPRGGGPDDQEDRRRQQQEGQRPRQQQRRHRQRSAQEGTRQGRQAHGRLPRWVVACLLCTRAHSLSSFTCVSSRRMHATQAARRTPATGSRRRLSSAPRGRSSTATWSSRADSSRSDATSSPAAPSATTCSWTRTPPSSC